MSTSKDMERDVFTFSTPAEGAEGARIPINPDSKKTLEMETSKPPSPLRATKDNKGKSKGKIPKKKEELLLPKLSIPLSYDEIKEDMYAMTGVARLTRTPKKRPQDVQKRLNSLFPGMDLHKITPGRYNVPGEPPFSGKE